jgi:DNA-directed RNA polymerase specialized sigma24 family protein
VRERASARRGGGAVRLTVDTGLAESMPASPPSDEPLRVDAALSALEQVEPRLAKVVEMRYFAGLSTVEIAALLGVTDRTVRRDWDKARLLLRTMLAG